MLDDWYLALREGDLSPFEIGMSVDDFVVLAGPPDGEANCAFDVDYYQYGAYQFTFQSGRFKKLSIVFTDGVTLAIQRPPLLITQDMSVYEFVEYCHSNEISWVIVESETWGTYLQIATCHQTRIGFDLDRPYLHSIAVGDFTFDYDA